MLIVEHSDRTIDHQAGCVAQEDLPGGVARHVEDAGLRFEAPQLSPRLALSHQRLQAACVRSAVLCGHDMKRKCAKNLCRNGFGEDEKVEQLDV